LFMERNRAIILLVKHCPHIYQNSDTLLAGLM
jgi:hypothetical protein